MTNVRMPKLAGHYEPPKTPYHYRFTVKKNNEIVFVTSEQQQYNPDPSFEKAKDVYYRLKKAFPKEEGYAVEMHGGSMFMSQVKMAEEPVPTSAEGIGNAETEEEEI